MAELITAERLREVLHYDPLTGVFTWLERISIRIKVGDEAGWIQDGHRFIGIEGRDYPVARLAWLYMTGEWPPHFIDHKDLDGTNNVWLNLRPATNAQNVQNSGRKVTNKSGYKGVYFETWSRKWRASITVNYQVIRLGRFFTPEAAYIAYCEAANKYHGEFARTRGRDG